MGNIKWFGVAIVLFFGLFFSLNSFDVFNTQENQWDNLIPSSEYTVSFSEQKIIPEISTIAEKTYSNRLEDIQ